MFVLSSLAHTLEKAAAQILDAAVEETNDLLLLRFLIEVRDRCHLDETIDALRRTDSALSVIRRSFL
jgi:(p)ppGpp synthase/HD superfamily hydrolase